MTTLFGRASLGWGIVLIRDGFLVFMNFRSYKIP